MLRNKLQSHRYCTRLGVLGEKLQLCVGCVANDECVILACYSGLQNNLLTIVAVAPDLVNVHESLTQLHIEGISLHYYIAGK